MAGATFDRLLVCLPERPPFETVLQESAKLASALGAWTVEVVAAPAHDLHASRRGLIPALLGHRAGDIHLVPTADRTVTLAASLADQRSLIVAGPREARRLPRRLPAAALVLTTALKGRSVLAVVDPDRAAPALLTAALAMAGSLGVPRVVACHPWYDEAAIASEPAEHRAIAARQERLSIFLARVPHADVTIDPRVVFSPNLTRTVSRVAAEEEAALVVAPEPLFVSSPVLVLPPAVACRPRPPSPLAALWAGFLDGRLRA